MSNNQTPPPPSERASVGSKTRSRNKTVGEIQHAIVRLQASQSKVSISAVAKLASINQVLLHEIAVFKGMESGKVVSILHPKQPVG